jgi:hypothetical protein
LGYFIPATSVPEDIAKHIAAGIRLTYSVRALKNYERSSNKWKHLDRIRQMMEVKPVGKESMDFLGRVMRQAAMIKQDLVDIINVSIEELVRKRFELPAFDTLLREAKKTRAATNSLIYRGIYERASAEARSAADEILKTDPETKRSLWNDLRQDPGKLTIKEINRMVDRLTWLRGIGRLEDPFRKVPHAKVRHLADMLRIVLSIQEGRVSPSTILRRLGTHSRKNKLYFAFQELGKVVRSAYLLKYIRDPDLRRKVNHATTVSEAFNDFIQFVTFGNKGIIAKNTRDQQRKTIRYGHLVANIFIFMNVFDQSVILSDLVREGHVITQKVAETSNPYRTAHLNRFGAYFLNEARN